MLKKLTDYPKNYKYIKPYFQSFGFRLYIFFGFALIFLVGINTYFNIGIQEKQLVDEVLMGADNLSQVVKYSTRNYMLENRDEEVQNAINYIADRTDGTKWIRVIDNKGVIKKSTNKSEIGDHIDITSSQCAICHIGDKVIDNLTREQRTRIVPSDDGNYRMVSIIQPIYNEYSCSTLCHTSHPTSQKILGIFDIAMSFKEIDKKTAMNRNRFIMFGSASFFLIMTCLGIMLNYFLIRPVNALLVGFYKVTKGDLNAQIPVFTNDEFGRLSQSFNKMLNELQKEIAYRNLLLYEETTFEKQEQPVKKSQASGSALPEKSDMGRSFEEIYQRIKDETHLKLVQAVKLKSLGELSAGIAHEINNPLTAVLSYSSLLLDKIKTPKEQAWLNVIVDESKRCRNIVAGLLEFSRQSPPEKVPTHINHVVERAVSLIQHQESFHNIKIIKQLDPELPKVRIDSSQIYQVFMNLLINAADAMQGNGQLNIESKLFIAMSKVAEDKKFVDVSFTDKGSGIPMENIDRIFDPFFTTKGPTVGTGLGLSICYGIIKRHNGNILVESKLGEGSIFTVRLPIEEVGEL
jgi:two-component system, NtrC family, sensor kinase